MTLKTRVRSLTGGDAALFRRLLDLFGDAFEAPETYRARQPDDDYIERLLAKDHFIALAAFDAEDRLTGALTAYELQKFEQARSEIYIYDLAVRAENRRQGVATCMIRHLQELAAERRAWMIIVRADPVDEPAVALYSKLGRREDVLHFDIDVAGIADAAAHPPTS